MDPEFNLINIVLEQAMRTNDRMNSLMALRETIDLEEIAEALYGEDFMALEFIMSNPLLSAEQCRYLWLRQENEGASARNIILSHPNFPADLLYELALDRRTVSVARDIIMAHPNATEEIRTIIALTFSESDRYDNGSL
jgi:hypothetical protein